MPARTALGMGATFSGKLVIDNSGWYYLQGDGTWSITSPQSYVGAGFLFCGAQITATTENRYALLEGVYPTPPIYRGSLYYKYTITVGAGIGTQQSVDVYYRLGDASGSVVQGTQIPEDAIVVSGPLEVPFEFSVSGIYAGTEITNSEPVDRMSPKDYTDRTFGTSWYADENTSCTATVTVPGYGDLTATKTGLGYNTGDPVDAEPHDLGSNFACGWQLALRYAPEIDASLVAIKDPQFSSSGINLGSLDLHNPGTGDTPPDAITAGWYYDPPASGGYWHVHNDSGIAIERCTATTTSGISWAGCTSLPYLVSVVFNDGAFSDATGYAIDYDCGAVDWNGGEYVPHYFTGDETRDEFHSDWDPDGWRKWGGHTFSAMEKNAWRAANGEDVGGGIANENDARAGLKVPPINATNWDFATLGSMVWEMMTVSLADSIDINDPIDAPSRPNDWAAVSGCSVSGDVWTVGISATSPKVKRVLKTRYWLRLNNLQGYSEDPELPRDFNWPIMCRPNINLTNGEDGTDIETAVPYEDEWHFDQYAYLALGLTAAKAGTVTMQIKYSTVNVYDPCYPSVAYRADEWEYTRTQATATYNIDVEAGANSLQVDLCCPSEGTVPHLWHVDEIWFTLPNGGESTEEYTLTELALTKDTINTNTLKFRAVRCWQWADNLGFGIGAIHDGKHVLWIGDAYGYSAHRNEKCLSYIQYAQHNPGSTAEGDPSTAKSLARMVNEIGWLRGWSVEYNINDVDPNPYNEDEDGNVQSSEFYSWDLQEAHESSETSRKGASTVGYWEMLAGTRNTIHVEKYPRGRIEGIAKVVGGKSRARNETGGVYIQGFKGGVATLSEAVNTDAQGWFSSSPIKELDATYIAGASTGLTAVNREYTTAIAYLPQGVDFVRLDGRWADIVWRIYETGGIVLTDRWEAAGSYTWNSFGGNVFEAEDTYPDIAILDDGTLLACATINGDTLFKALRNLDDTWAAITTATIGDGLINGGIGYLNGMVWFCGCDDTAGDGTIYVRGSSNADLTSEALNASDDITLTVATYTGGTPVCDLQVCNETRQLLVTVADATGMKFYRCSNTDDGFSQVTG